MAYLRQNALGRAGLLLCLLAMMPPPPARSQTAEAISGLGFVEPAGGVVRVSGPVSSGAAAVAELRVGEGDFVSEGQVMAVLDNNARYKAALRQAETEVKVREARLQQVLAGATASEIDAQRAIIRRITVELNAAQVQCARLTTLAERGSAAIVAVDRECSLRDAALQRLSEAEARLATISGVRSEDVALREAELENAVAAVSLASADVERTVVRAPIAGQVLVIHSKTGERISDQGVLEMGRTDQMWVSAEIYETDISLVQVGQSASIRSDGFAGVLNGVVKVIGLVVGRNDILATDPSADVDARVVEVKIAVDPEDSTQVAGLTNLQVFVVIDPTQ